MLLVIFLNILNQLTGINLFVQYSETILKGFGLTETKNVTKLISLANVMAGIVATVFTKKIGLKYLLVIGLFF